MVFFLTVIIFFIVHKKCEKKSLCIILIQQLDAPSKENAPVIRLYLSSGVNSPSPNPIHDKHFTYLLPSFLTSLLTFYFLPSFLPSLLTFRGSNGPIIPHCRFLATVGYCLGSLAHHYHEYIKPSYSAHNFPKHGTIAPAILFCVL